MLSMEQHTPMSFSKANENWTGHSGQPSPSAPVPDKPPSPALHPGLSPAHWVLVCLAQWERREPLRAPALPCGP